LLEHGFAQNLFKKRKHNFGCIGFNIEKLGELSKRENRAFFVSVIEIVQLWQNLRAFIIPYIC